jgi:polyisoprenoid-binding protein YceI
MKSILSRLIIIIFLLGASAYPAFADSQYVFTCDTSKIKGSIKYSVLGRYISDFKECAGSILYDELTKKIKSVRLEIKAKSIHSSCQWCDNIVISKKLLDTEQYPLIVFESKDFKKDSEGYWANGMIDMHGVSQKLNSQFNVTENKSGELSLSGSWVLRRKDFKITWNKLLDHGGVLVGDHITVDWEVRAKKI